MLLTSNHFLLSFVLIYQEQIESIISIDSRKDACSKSKHILDYSKIDLPLIKPSSTALAQSVSSDIVYTYQL